MTRRKCRLASKTMLAGYSGVAIGGALGGLAGSGLNGSSRDQSALRSRRIRSLAAAERSRTATAYTSTVQVNSRSSIAMKCRVSPDFKLCGMMLTQSGCCCRWPGEQTTSSGAGRGSRFRAARIGSGKGFCREQFEGAAARLARLRLREGEASYGHLQQTGTARIEPMAKNYLRTAMGQRPAKICAIRKGRSQIRKPPLAA